MPTGSSLGITFSPIGIARTPFADKASAPRQPYAASGALGTIELYGGHGFEHALEDLEGWDRIWVLFWFHLNEGWRPKVLPPRSEKRRGVFSTRSPHRPNPIGLSVVRLQSVAGLVLHVCDIDLVDGTPILDIKPYVPIADAHPDARTGWLAPIAPLAQRATDGSVAPVDPEPGFEVVFADLAAEQSRFLVEAHGVDVAQSIARTLALGPQPHPYRRIKPAASGFLLAIKDWRAAFHVEGRRVTVDFIASGYRAKQLDDPNLDDPTLAAHRAFVERFGRATL